MKMMSLKNGIFKYCEVGGDISTGGARQSPVAGPVMPPNDVQGAENNEQNEADHDVPSPYYIHRGKKQKAKQ